MLPRPPVPGPVGWREQVRLGRDYYVRLDANNNYSVDSTAIGRMVDVSAYAPPEAARPIGAI